MEVNFEDTKRLVNKCAKSVADVVFCERIGDDELWQKIEDEAEAMAYGYVTNGLQILASYGWSDALYGGVDREDSPLYQFEEDVHNMVIELLEGEGIEVYD